MDCDPQPDPAEPQAEGTRPRRRWLRRAALLVGGAVAALVLAEAALQLAGLEIRAERLVRDPILGWRNRPGYADETLSINSHGCIGPEFSAAKPPGVVRVVCLGDSCTAGDLLPNAGDRYPRQLERELERRYRERDIRVINAGVGGYSSLQGRLWLEREVLDWEPDLVVIYFGWNDHWPARTGGPDAQVAGSWRDRLRAWLGWSKVLQLIHRGYRRLVHRPVVVKEKEGQGRVTVPTDERVRVPLEDYRANLAAMVAATRERGGRCCLVTAPNYLELLAQQGRAPTHESLGDQETVEAVVELHAQYNQATREVARETGASLVDAARDFHRASQSTAMLGDGAICRAPRSGYPARLFWQPPGKPIDFIHLSPEGCGLLARAIVTSRAVRELMERGAEP
jgi:lysophospholipase L1-like esterase